MLMTEGWIPIPEALLNASPPTDDDWLTVPEAARLTGLPEEEVHRRGRNIKRGASYTIYGVPPGRPGLPAGLTALPADQLKRLRAGRIVLNRNMVLVWKEIEDRIREARAAGARSEREIAAEHGVTVAEVRRSVRRIEEQERIKKLQDEGRTVEEIAEALGMKPGTVRHRLREAEALERWRQQHRKDARP